MEFKFFWMILLSIFSYQSQPDITLCTSITNSALQQSCITVIRHVWSQTSRVVSCVLKMSVCGRTDTTDYKQMEFRHKRNNSSTGLHDEKLRWTQKVNIRHKLLLTAATLSHSCRNSCSLLLSSVQTSANYEFNPLNLIYSLHKKCLSYNIM